MNEITASVLREHDPEAFAREIEEIRDALRDYLNFTSLRQTSREIGMSPTGLSKFINGTDPYLHTRSKLRAWMKRRRAQ